MKIRSDFVTNSSSVSYVLTMKADLVRIFRSSVTYDNPEKLRVFDALVDFIRGGEVVNACGETLYSRKIEFKTDNDVEYRENANEVLDYANMSDEELWYYIYGDYILNGELSDLMIFGATQTETF